MLSNIKNIFIMLCCIILFISFTGCGDIGGSNNGSKEYVPKKIEDSFDITDINHINWFGRTYTDTNGTHWFNHSASGFEVNFYGTKLAAVFEATQYNSEPNRPVLAVYLDGVDDPFEAEILVLKEKTTTVILAENLENKLHTIKVLKRSETQQSQNALVSIKTDGDFYTPPKKQKRKLEFYGDSITCGYGITADSDEFNTMAEDGTATYAAVAARQLNAEYHVIAGSGKGLYVSPYQPKTIPDVYKLVDFASTTLWNFDYIPDAVIINLGTNDNGYIDSLSTKAEKDVAVVEFQTIYKKFIKELNSYYPNAEIVAVYNMMAPSNAHVHNGFESFIEKLKTEEDLPVTVLKLPSMYNDSSNIKLYHPGYATHKKSGDLLAQHLKELLNW